MTQIGRCVEKKILPLVMMVFIVILVNYQASIASPDDPCTSERDRYLLLDTRIIESTENAKLTIGKVQKHKDNPLFEEDKPWEKRFDNLYANVIYDEQENIYKCW
ncbi:MAG: hypothetical protein ACYSR3_02710 [Planctomycetota bacterium]|jgi:hypothetical protein